MKPRCIYCIKYKCKREPEYKVHTCKVHKNIVVKGTLQDPIKEDCTDFQRKPGNQSPNKVPAWAVKLMK